MSVLYTLLPHVMPLHAAVPLLSALWPQALSLPKVKILSAGCHMSCCYTVHLSGTVYPGGASTLETPPLPAMRAPSQLTIGIDPPRCGPAAWQDDLLEASRNFQNMCIIQAAALQQYRNCAALSDLLVPRRLQCLRFWHGRCVMSDSEAVRQAGDLKSSAAEVGQFGQRGERTQRLLFAQWKSTAGTWSGCCCYLTYSALCICLLTLC